VQTVNDHIEGQDTMKRIAVMTCVLTMAAGALASPPDIPNTPAAVDDLLYARPFTLEKEYKCLWPAERPHATTGMLLVLEIDKALVVPREIAMPILYVGDQPAERINHGHESGHVIVIVAGEVDLTQVPIWFGTPGFPGQVNLSTAKSERVLAEKAGIKPFPQKKVKAALAKGGPHIRAVDQRAMLRDHVAPLILEYCPDEKNLAEDFRVPVLRKAPVKDEN
jgi:hypothetical protein